MAPIPPDEQQTNLKVSNGQNQAAGSDTPLMHSVNPDKAAQTVRPYIS